MYIIKKYNDLLDLSDFYSEADKRGFVNNNSKQSMIDCFKNEKEWCAWILYKNNIAVGSVSAHSLDILGKNSYRICARTCVLTNLLSELYGNGLLNINVIIKHQNVTDQFFIPICIDWAGKDKDLYITSNNSVVGSQRLVHSIYCPTLERMGILTKSTELVYRGHLQTFWKFNVDAFYNDLKKYLRWESQIF